VYVRARTDNGSNSAFLTRREHCQMVPGACKSRVEIGASYRFRFATRTNEPRVSTREM